MKLLSFIAFIFFSVSSFSQSGAIPAQQNPPRLVNNFSKEFPEFLSKSEEQALETKLVNFSKETSNQIVVVIVDNFGDNDANSFATELGRTWGVGQKDFKNGVIVLINPTGRKGHRIPPYIAVGYGLEGAIPDITAKHICEKEIAPSFRNGNFYEGLNAGTDVLMKLAKGEINSKSYNVPSYKQKGIYLLLAFLLILFLFRVFKGGAGGGFGSGMATGFFIGGGGWGHGGGGSSGGGGFGGFGGGSFGGGGGGGGSW